MTITNPTSEGRPRHPTAAEPQIIQGGMGVAVSGWKLARAVSVTGQLGVVSGTALELVCARRLQSGDAGGHMRRALAAFPVPEVAEWILEAYYVPGGIAPGVLFRPVPRHTIESSLRLLELTVAANFVEVFLAKEGHDGLVGVNYLRKIELPLPAALYGAVLAGVDAVLVGAGSPSEIPELTRRLARHEDVTLDIRVQGARSDDGLGSMGFSPRQVVPLALAPIEVPRVIGIVASADLAAGLAGTPVTRPDGFVVEGPRAGGHNAPPRGPRRVDEIGQPVYDERDEVEVSKILALGLPVWLAGSYGTPQGLRDALALGAAGVQVGTAFAYSDESGFDEGIKERVRREVSSGELRVRADWRVSPTGFPFQVADLPGTLSDPAVVSARKPVCDLGVLRSAYVKPDGAVDYRCPAEPEAQYRRKGGREANKKGRVCLCNALLASAGLPQRRPNGDVEAPLVTSGGDLRPVAALVA
ncbi:MAG TPA: nitronate monooxygenase, partial [Candidatus Lustribacter sp.]|nr:nitronate monooxygenase [Candidatus Lustribacter sp.]